MPPEAVAQITEVFCTVLEELAFLFGDPIDKAEMPEPQGELVQARIAYHGEQSGELRLTLPRALCGVVAANVLGLEPDDPDAERRALDALGELLNVICGQTLTALAGEQAIFNLTPPQVQNLPADQWRSTLHDDLTLAFTIDGQGVLLTVRMA